MAAREQTRRTSPSRVSDQEDEMRANDHPSGEQIRDRVAAVARASARAASTEGIAT